MHSHTPSHFSFHKLSLICLHPSDWLTGHLSVLYLQANNTCPDPSKTIESITHLRVGVLLVRCSQNSGHCSEIVLSVLLFITVTLAVIFLNITRIQDVDAFIQLTTIILHGLRACVCMRMFICPIGPSFRTTITQHSQPLRRSIYRRTKWTLPTGGHDLHDHRQWRPLRLSTRWWKLDRSHWVAGQKCKSVVYVWTDECLAVLVCVCVREGGG